MPKPARAWRRLHSHPFKQLCKETLLLHLKKYPWYPTTATVHKLLVHGAQVIECSVLPVGSLGEKSSEARNKLYKRDRLLHSRKNSRVNNLTDVFHRALDSSDPFLPSISWQKKIQFSSFTKSSNCAFGDPPCWSSNWLPAFRVRKNIDFELNTYYDYAMNFMHSPIHKIIIAPVYTTQTNS